MTPEDARRGIAAIRADMAHPFFAESHPEHGRAVRDVEALYVQAYPEPVENPFDRPPPMKAPPPADPGVKHRERGSFWEQSAPIPREDLQAARPERDGARPWWRKAGEWVDEEASKAWKDFLLGSPPQRAVQPASPTEPRRMSQMEAKDQALGFATDLLPKQVRDGCAVTFIDILRRNGQLPSEEIRPEDIPIPRWEDHRKQDWVSGGLVQDHNGDVIWVDRHKPKVFHDNLEGATSIPSIPKALNDDLRDQQWHRDAARTNFGMSPDGRPPGR